MNETKQQITVESFLDSKELREQVMDQVEVLDKVKALFLIPELECMTIKQVADYYEVDIDTIKKQYQRNKEEFDADGTQTKKLSDFKFTNGTRSPARKVAQTRTYLDITFENGVEIKIPNCGIKCYPKRAILRMGMLLRGSKVAREIRTQLLNVFEHATDEQKTAEINEETSLLNGIGFAFGTGNGVEILQACMALDQYRKRYINTLEVQKSELEEKNTKLSGENEVLAAEEARWGDRETINKLIRSLASALGYKQISFLYKEIYDQLLYKYHINLKARRTSKEGKWSQKPLLLYVKDNEWKYFYKLIAAMCSRSGVHLENIFQKAGVDYEKISKNA